MSKVKSTAKHIRIKENSTKWAQAISEIEREIGVAQNRIGRLQRAIAIFKEMDATGICWPGEVGAKKRAELQNGP